MFERGGRFLAPLPERDTHIADMLSHELGCVLAEGITELAEKQHTHVASSSTSQCSAASGSGTGTWPLTLETCAPIIICIVASPSSPEQLTQSAPTSSRKARVRSSTRS